MDDIQKSIAIVEKIPAVATILNVVCKTTGMGFAAVARVTEEHWVACGVRDEIGFGLGVGGELVVDTTICHEIRQFRKAVVINNVPEDALFRDHPTPRMYGFQSYISVPIILSDSRFFGTLCSIDPHPNVLDEAKTLGMFELFAELLAFHIETREKLQITQTRLDAEQRIGELREQFVAVTSREIKDPMTGILIFSKLLEEQGEGSLNPVQQRMVSEIADSAEAMVGLISKYLDGDPGSPEDLSIKS